MIYEPPATPEDTNDRTPEEPSSPDPLEQEAPPIIARHWPL